MWGKIYIEVLFLKCLNKYVTAASFCCSAHYVILSQKRWVELLDTAQFCYSLHKFSSIGLSPFELCYGQQPLTPHVINL